MEPQTVIARRIARELSPGMLVNLGIGIPTLVANFVPEACMYSSSPRTG
jgi:acetate CoA/acetoacetate CoA-transferase beta subunit